MWKMIGLIDSLWDQLGFCQHLSDAGSFGQASGSQVSNFQLMQLMDTLFYSVFDL